MPLSYIGGKSKIAPKLIVPNIPKDIETYCEVFGGMFWTFFSMDLSKFPNLKNIVYNDINPLNYNLFQCLFDPSKLLEEVNKIPCQKFGEDITPSEYRDLFNQFQKEIFDPNFTVENTDYEVAAKYAYILTQVFSGSKPETSSYIDLKGKYKSKYLTFRDKLSNPKWVDYFLKITHVEKMDFEEIILKYDQKNSYFYVDPPYWKTENYYSNHDFDRNDHERLSTILKNIKGRFSLSYYDFELLEVWYPKNNFEWKSQKFNKAAAAKKGVKQTVGEELLIMNY
jgi:DNA adenine methylase